MNFLHAEIVTVSPFLLLILFLVNSLDELQEKLDSEENSPTLHWDHATAEAFGFPEGIHAYQPIWVQG